LKIILIKKAQVNHKKIGERRALHKHYESRRRQKQRSDEICLEINKKFEIIKMI